MFNPCAVIPVYNHGETIGAVVDGVLRHGLPCVLVDDGSAAPCALELDRLAAERPERITLLRHPDNRGKGAAVLSGFRHAAQAGFSHLLQIDADGQHDTADIPAFLAQARAHPGAVIAGCPVYDASVPGLRFYARYLTHVWVWINTLSFSIRDAMCGFRVYPVAPVTALAARVGLGQRMDFDIEILVRLHWEGLEIRNQRTRVTYPADGVSHFRGVLDNLLISRTHARLFFTMLARLPARLLRPGRGS